MRIWIPLLSAAWFGPVQQIFAQQLDADTVTRASSASSIPKFWGVTLDLGSATINVDKLNTYFAPYTAATISREGVSQAIQLVLSDHVFGSGAFFYQQAITFPEEDRSKPTLSLHQHTAGFELHKILVDKRIKVVLPSLGMGWRLSNVTYSPAQPASLPLDSLFQQASSFTIRNHSILVTAGAGVYYVVRGFRAAGIRQLDLGFSGSYAYNLRPGDWSVLGTSTTALVPPTRFDYYTIRLSASLLLNR